MYYSIILVSYQDNVCVIKVGSERTEWTANAVSYLNHTNHTIWACICILVRSWLPPACCNYRLCARYPRRPPQRLSEQLGGPPRRGNQLHTFRSCPLATRASGVPGVQTIHSTVITEHRESFQKNTCCHWSKLRWISLLKNSHVQRPSLSCATLIPLFLLRILPWLTYLWPWCPTISTFTWR